MLGDLFPKLLDLWVGRLLGSWWLSRYHSLQQQLEQLWLRPPGHGRRESIGKPMVVLACIVGEHSRTPEFTMVQISDLEETHHVDEQTKIGITRD